jgi:hypothetical protein
MKVTYDALLGSVMHPLSLIQPAMTNEMPIAMYWLLVLARPG